MAIMSQAISLAYVLYSLFCLVTCDCIETSGIGEENVITTKYQMSGQEFVRDIFQKDKLLRITEAYKDWPIYHTWWNDGPELSEIQLNISKAGNPVTTYENFTLESFKKSSETGLSFEHFLREEDTVLAKSLLIPVNIMSCRDLYYPFLDTSTFALIGANYEIREELDIYEDSYFLFIHGGMIFNFKNSDESILFQPGDLIYFPKGICGSIISRGLVLSVRITWYQDTEDGRKINCSPINIYTANIVSFDTRNTSISAVAPPTLLNTRHYLPPIGLGTATLFDKTYETVKRALKIGYRLFDTSPMYIGDEKGNISAESEIGRAIKDSAMSRQDIFLVTRIPIISMKNNVAQVIAQSLENFQAYYIDLLVVELPFARQTEGATSPIADVLTVWAELKTLQKVGTIRSLGICNVKDVNEFRMILEEVGDSLSVVQNWFDPYHTEQEIRNVCQENNIAFMAYGTLGHKRMAESEEKDTNSVLSNPEILKKGRLLDTPPSGIILRWAMYQNVTTTPCTSDEYHLGSNYYSHQIHIDESIRNILDTYDEDFNAGWEDIIASELGDDKQPEMPPSDDTEEADVEIEIEDLENTQEDVDVVEPREEL